MADSSASRSLAGRIRGHIDGVIVAGPDVGIIWPALFEHKSLNAKSWADLVKRGVELSKPIYYAQLQIYMAYMDLGTALFTALNKDTQALHHEVVGFDRARRAGALRQGRRHHPRRGSGRIATAHRRQPGLLSLSLVRLRPALLGGRA